MDMESNRFYEFRILHINPLPAQYEKLRIFSGEIVFSVVPLGRTSFATVKNDVI